MIGRLDVLMHVREAYMDAEEVPTIILHGVVPAPLQPGDPNGGPMHVLLKGTAVDLHGVTIGEEVRVRLEVAPRATP